MKFRTELRVAPFDRPIGFDEQVLALGSCFADELRTRLAALKFRIAGNFAGPLFNPESIAAAIDRAAAEQPYTMTDLARDDEGMWFCYDTATRFDDPDPAQVVARCNAAQKALRETLAAARHVIVTFGTAQVYRLRETGAVVANCHRRPAALFRRERLGVDAIVERWSELLAGPLSGRRLILTVSPIRHIGDGLEANAVSKAVLRVAAAELAERHPDTVRYFPASEILTDALRDYRFYADDLVHPAPQAVDYILERFAETAFTPETRRRAAEVERLVAFCRHTPRRAGSEADRRACAEQLAALERFEAESGIDFKEEIAQLKGRISR